MRAKRAFEGRKASNGKALEVFYSGYSGFAKVFGHPNQIGTKSRKYVKYITFELDLNNKYFGVI